MKPEVAVLGRYRRLRRVADSAGLFRILANEHRLWLRDALTSSFGRQPTAAELQEVKATITSILAPEVSAILLDPDYGIPGAMSLCPAGDGLLISYESVGYESVNGIRIQETPSRPVNDAVILGADGVKLQVYYHPDAPGEILEHQRALVHKVGEECANARMPFFLEPSGYEIRGDGFDSAAYARDRDRLVLRTVEEFLRPDYHVDVMMLEFPADLKYTVPFTHGAFDGRERPIVYDLGEVRNRLEAMQQMVTIPWILVGAGVTLREFLENLALAAEHGASGYLGGWSFFRPALEVAKDNVAFCASLKSHAQWAVRRANATISRGRPWNFERGSQRL